MRKLSLVSWDEFVKRLRELGFEGQFPGGKHPKMRKEKLTLIIPNKHEGDIGIGFLTRLLRQAGISKEEWLGINSQSGLSIVATVMIMLILALFAAAAVSLVTTATGTGIQEERGVGAFYIADGGMYYTLKLNTYPYYDTSVSSIPLGDISGSSFTVTVPTLSSGINDTANSMTVSDTDGFTAAPDASFWALLCDDYTASDPRPNIRMSSSDCEKISCTSAFATCTRGRDSTSPANHLSNAVVMTYAWKNYAWDTVSAQLNRNLQRGAKCKNPASTICVNSTNGFADSGFIRVHYDTGNSNSNEDIFYEGIGSDETACGTGCTACLGTTSCTRRAYDSDGTGNGTVNHSSGTTVYQSEFSVLVKSTGITPGAIILTNIKRVLQTNVLPLKDP